MTHVLSNPLHSAYDDVSLRIEETWRLLHLVRVKGETVKYPIDLTTSRVIGQLPSVIESIVRTLDASAVMSVDGFYYVIQFTKQ